jgi:hypothetical protein
MSWLSVWSNAVALAAVLIVDSFVRGGTPNIGRCGVREILRCGGISSRRARTRERGMALFARADAHAVRIRRLGAVDWVTISALATAAGTLVLAVATFASVRSANRAARVAELSLLANLRPLLLPSRIGDPELKFGYQDGHWVKLAGGSGIADVTDSAIYLALSLRNVGSGIAVLHGWRFEPDVRLGAHEAPDVATFTALSRDLYVPAGDVGFWQGTFRDPTSEEFAAARDAIAEGRRLAVDVLYGDHEGGQRVISRFTLTPRETGDGWLGSSVRHWNVDRADPRPR